VNTKKRVSSIILLCVAVGVFAQTTAPVEKTTPLWVKDLRRAEIVAFGSFPFALFTTIFAFDVYRFASHSGDILYAPWPIKPAGAVALTQDELKTTIKIAIGLSLAISAADFIIVHYKRGRQARLAANAPGETPIVIKRPWPDTNQGE
jgi:hypothetical protein